MICLRRFWLRPLDQNVIPNWEDSSPIRAPQSSPNMTAIVGKHAVALYIYVCSYYFEECHIKIFSTSFNVFDY